MRDIPESARLKWREVLEAFEGYIAVKTQFYREAGLHRVSLVREALGCSPSGWSHHLAFEIAEGLNENEQMEILPNALFWCCSDKSVHLAKPFVLNLPRQRVVEVIETLAEPILSRHFYADWIYLLQLFDELDKAIALRFANRMASHEDFDIREQGCDYLKDLETSEEKDRKE